MSRPSLTPQERAALERMKRDAKKSLEPSRAVPAQVRSERFFGPIGIDDAGELFPVPAESPGNASVTRTEKKSKKKR